MSAVLTRGALVNKVLQRNSTSLRLFTTTPCSSVIQKSTLQNATEQNQYKREPQYTEMVRDFIDPLDFYSALTDIGINFFCGVPDSLLKDFCSVLTTSVPETNHIITANEGNAVAMAAGYHLATHKTALVYLQNSGLGNMVNPLLSLTSPSVYSIPMLLLIGWRGEPGKRDEPQHQAQGQVTPGLLASLEIPFQVLPDYKDGAVQTLETARQYMKTHKSPYCLLVKRQTFSQFKLPTTVVDEFAMSREEALQSIIDGLDPRDIVVSSTGMLSRELFEYREAKCLGHEKDFLTVGSMGHASSIALAISKFRANRQVFCLDGDGAAIMHMGAMATIGQRAFDNFKHVIINNGKHDSVGGQPTDAGKHAHFHFCRIARACGYKEAWTASTPEEIADSILRMRMTKGPVMLEIKTKGGSRKDLGRPTRSPLENKSDFMNFLAMK